LQTTITADAHQRERQFLPEEQILNKVEHKLEDQQFSEEGGQHLEQR
jgi:hypothetical protein